MAASTTWPRFECPRSSSASRMPSAHSMPPPAKSPSRLTGGSGLSPLPPSSDSAPEMAKELVSWPALSAERRQLRGDGIIIGVVAAHVGVRALLAEPGQARVHQPCVALLRDIRSEPEPLHHAGAGGREQDAGIFHH